MAVELLAVSAGAMGITHRPRLASLAGLPAQGVTHVVTLLSRREGAPQLGAAVVAAGLGWRWVPLENGREPTVQMREQIAEAIAELVVLLDGGARLVLHCSAGIHRTGMVTYALLRCAGLDAHEALGALERMRPVTAAGMGEERLGWAEDLAAAATARCAVGGEPVT